MKKTFYTELAYVIGIIALAFGTALMERADFGMSMVVAPAYLIHLKVSCYLNWFSFGVAEYCFQALLLIILSFLVQRFKRKFLFSFVTAFIYGTVLDAMMKLVGILPGQGVIQRVAFFIVGIVLCAVGVSLLFHTYIAPEAYELFVKELSSKYKKEISKVKTIYDCCSCLIAILMSFIFIGFLQFEGVKAGTILCAIINGWLIGQCSKLFEKGFEFKDAFAFRKYFD